jgi:methionyl-tRNA formyltransferase
MDEKMDHGPILTQEKIIINSDDTYVTLSSRLMPLSAKLLLKTIPDWIDKKITPQEQDHDQATFCKLFTRDDGKIDWNQTAEKIYNLYRGLSPWPGIWTTWQGKRLKLTAIKPASLQLPPGQVSIHENRLYVGTADGAVEVLNVQLEGKKEMDTPLFINGYTQIEKDTLGTPYV